MRCSSLIRRNQKLANACFKGSGLTMPRTGLALRLGSACCLAFASRGNPARPTQQKPASLDQLALNSLSGIELVKLARAVL
jgi:hypothetical protein